MQILVALVGDPNSAGELPEDEHWRAVRFDERPRVALAAEDDETLGNIMGTAARDFGARHQSGHDFYPAFIAFDQGGLSLASAYNSARSRGRRRARQLE